MNDLERHWCVAIRHGGKIEWTKAWAASRSSHWHSQRPEILSALTCSRDRSRLKLLLSRTFDSSTQQDPGDTFIIIEKLAHNPDGRLMAFNFIKTNWHFLGRQ